MMFRPIVSLAAVLLLTNSIAFAEDKAKPADNATSDQQISEFSLAGYGEKGKKTWDLAGKSADIFTDTVKLDKVKGNLYGKEENITLTSERGDFNKVDGKVHLEENVVITTTSGTKLTTDTLDWDRKNQKVTTDDKVNIERDTMTIVAQGAKGEPNLKKVALDKDVRLDLNPKEGDAKGVKEKITITCDGPLNIDYEKNVAVFNNNVKVERQDSVIYSDTMEVYFLTGDKANPEANPEITEAQKSNSLMGSKIDKIIAKGNVRVVRGENVSYSQEAIYTAADKKITLTGRPRLELYSSEDLK